MSDHRTEFRGEICSRSATVGVISLGYVGLPLALVFDGGRPLVPLR